MHKLVSAIIITHASCKEEPGTGKVLRAETSSVKITQHGKCMNVPRFLVLVANWAFPSSKRSHVQHNLAILLSILFIIIFIFHGLVYIYISLKSSRK